MLSPALTTALQAQIGYEFGASQTYLGMAAHFHAHNLEKWAAFFERQSLEEREHALKIFHFLLETGSPAKLPAIAEAPVQYTSALEVLQKSLQQEQRVTQAFKDMSALALREADFTGFGFLQWFLSEQVEEEASFERLIALVESGINLFQAQALLDG
jgi:bacterioferritin B